MNILQVEDDDKNFDCYSDWLVNEAEQKFLAGNGEPYTHIQVGNEIIECETVRFKRDGSFGVIVGETIALEHKEE